MMRRTPMKRTGFARHQPAERERRMPTVTPGAFRTGAPVATHAAPVHKDAPVRSEAYRRAVASLPCIHCGLQGYSQHAHANAGKGLGLKTDDRAGFPLCCTRPGHLGCHAQFDQYRLFPRTQAAEMARIWGERTRAEILRLGIWPKSTPAWTDSPTTTKVPAYE